MSKGYLRTLEAVIAIVIILLFIYAVLPRFQDSKDSNEVILLKDSILNEISENENLRGEILGYNSDVELDVADVTDLTNFVRDTLASLGSYDFRIMVQSPDSTFQIPILPQETEKKDVISDSILIAADLNTNNPKIVTLYFWEK